MVDLFGQCSDLIFRDLAFRFHTDAGKTSIFQADTDRRGQGTHRMGHFRDSIGFSTRTGISGDNRSGSWRDSKRTAPRADDTGHLPDSGISVLFYFAYGLYDFSGEDFWRKDRLLRSGRSTGHIGCSGFSGFNRFLRDVICQIMDMKYISAGKKTRDRSLMHIRRERSAGFRIDGQTGLSGKRRRKRRGNISRNPPIR